MVIFAERFYWFLTPERPSVATTLSAASATLATITCSPIVIYFEYLSMFDIISPGWSVDG